MQRARGARGHSLESPAAPLVSRLSGTCMDVQGMSKSAGASVVIWGCNGDANQQWAVPAVGATGEVRVYGTMCLDAFGGAGNDRDRIVIWTCHGGANQRWTYTAAGELRGINGKCVDVADAGTADGSPLILWSCHG